MANIIFFGGKGGVGKTTCSAAYAMQCANKGLKTLIVSTDPAHSTSDIFEKNIGMNITNIQNNLDGIEIDAEYESNKYIEGIRGNLGSILSPIIVDEINKQLDAASVSPGSHESAMFDKMIEIINLETKNYDRIIFDTAPTGHTLRLVSLPELLSGWMDTLIKKRRKAIKLSQMAKRKGIDEEAIREDSIIKILSKRKANMENARKILIDEKLLSFIFVLNAEKLPIDETKKAVEVLEKYGVKVNAIVVNRILPSDSKDSFLINKKEKEAEYMKEIEKYFKGKYIYQLPWLAEDMKSDNIIEIARYFEV